MNKACLEKYATAQHTVGVYGLSSRDVSRRGEFGTNEGYQIQSHSTCP